MMVLPWKWSAVGRIEERRKKRYDAKSLMFCSDDMVVRDFSSDGIGVWHVTEAPLKHEATFVYNSMVYVVKWVSKLSDNIYRYGAHYKETLRRIEKKSYISH